MVNNFSNKIINMQKEVEALKTAKIRAAGVLRVGTWTGTMNVNIVNYTPQKTARITITPTSAGDNMLTSVNYTGAWNNFYFRVLRLTGAGDSIVYYVHCEGDQAATSDIAFSVPIAVNYTAPCSVVLDYVDNIFGY